MLGRHQDLVVQLVVIERTATGLATTGDLPDRTRPTCSPADWRPSATRRGPSSRDRFADYDTRRARRAFDELADEVDSRSD